MPSLTTRLADGWAHARDARWLALVPFLVALLSTDKIERILAFHGRHVGIRFGLPAGVVDLWQFVSVPNEGVTVGAWGPDLTPLGLVVVLLLAGVRAGFMAGYFGSLRDALATGSYDFAASLRRYFLPFLAYTLVPMLGFLPVAAVGRAGGRAAIGPLVAVLLPAVLVLAYLFYATPYLIVLRETGLVAAARASLGLAVSGGPYLRYAAGFAGVVLVGSVLATAVVVNLGAVGIALGLVAAAPVGLACNLATMRFVADVDDRSPTLRSWDGDDPPQDPTPA